VTKPEWFVRRRIGFGVRPVTWQGWLITLVALATAIVGYVTLKKSAGDIAIACVALAYLLIALASGGTKRPNTKSDVDDEVVATQDGPCNIGAASNRDDH
jgi:hypothetical protein